MRCFCGGITDSPEVRHWETISALNARVKLPRVRPGGSVVLVNTVEASSVRGAHYHLWAKGVQDVVGCALTIGKTVIDLECEAYKATT